jgi:nucleoside-diphosphate-sugar epimerase
MSRDGLPAVILRPCLIAGEGKRGGDLLRLFKLCRRGLFPVFASSLDTAKPLVAVDDVVQALLLASVRGRAGEVYLVHSGARHTLGQILEVAGRLVGNPRPYRRLPLLPAFAAAQLVASLARGVGRTPPLSPERLELYLTDRSIVIDKARRELGYQPCHQDLDDMLGRAFRDFARTGQL